MTHAWRGITYTFRHEQNFRIQLFCAMVVLFGMWYFALTKSEMIVVAFLSMFVLILELLNSAIEVFADIVKPRLHVQVQVVKDIMAAMVLLAAVGALCIGAIIFIPHIIESF